MLRLPAVGVRRLRELVTDAWRMRAPADLVDAQGLAQVDRRRGRRA
jgi:hypothetical protein